MRRKKIGMYLYFNRYDIDLLNFLNSIPVDIFSYVIKEVIKVIYFKKEDTIIGLLKEKSNDLNLPFRKYITFYEDEELYTLLIKKNSYERNVFIKQIIREYVYTRWQKEKETIITVLPEEAAGVSDNKRTIKDTFVFQAIKGKQHKTTPM